MVLRKISGVGQYVKLLHDNAAELTALYEDILIHVTGFFREPEAFRALKDTILPKLLRNRSPE